MILIADDDNDITLLVKISLEKAGFLVVSFTDPIAALEEFRSHSADYDPVISDIRMPRMNGYKFVQQVKKLRPDIKILIISAFGYNDTDIPNNFSRSDIDEFIEKPISLYRLNKIVLTHTTKN
jgi:two-component system response regulator ChvI